MIFLFFPYGKVKTHLPARLVVPDLLLFCLPGSGIPMGLQGGAISLNLGDDNLSSDPL